MTKLARTWLFPSSLLGASASPVTISPNWLEFCLRHARSQTYSSTLWRKTWNLRILGSRSMSTRSLATHLKTASGETTQAAIHLIDLSVASFSATGCVTFLFYLLAFATGTSTHWKHHLKTLPKRQKERCCVGRSIWRKHSPLGKDTATVSIFLQIQINALRISSFLQQCLKTKWLWWKISPNIYTRDESFI